ncbi:MAG TPA: DNA primase [Nanoarchaeota archaeon]|nr:DNA primase [Candidatus Woesearchaeota archaeon]HIH15645.1 DNA primase [Nanoarchaeota archaeon]HIH58456.1 DNA primase [Nanoarchaeota archaeon]HII13613.1 DNA primase [Nanoarchaeota archaeon]HIJ04524.1 DNA primase [Nanoarchaeota archaeon]
MGKISQVSAKYIIHTSINIEGTVDRPDIIGAIFGQTEGLLGSDLELRELQKSGRIGRIEVNTDIKAGKTDGMIIIPSSLDKTETAIVAAAMETIQRIGPCNAKVKVQKLEDVRISKRNFVIQRAKELLKFFTENELPDSQEMAEEVSQSVRMGEVVEWGRERLPAGPGINDSEEIILCEGRADVLSLLKCGFKNVIALNGTSVPESIIPLCAAKVVTLFVDGDRGGDLITREVLDVAEIDFVVKAPDGKEVEELTQKEIHKALRGRITAEQAKMDLKDGVPTRNGQLKPQYSRQDSYRGGERNVRAPVAQQQTMTQPVARTASAVAPKNVVSDEQKKKFKQMLDDLVGTRGAYLLDGSMTMLGKVPSTELQGTLRSVKGVQAIVFDGSITRDLILLAEKNGIHSLVAMDSKVKPVETKINIYTMQSFS